MIRKVPIDWDDLEMALTINMEESTCYLNLRTGKVELSVDPSLVGDIGPSEEEIESGLAEGYHPYRAHRVICRIPMDGAVRQLCR